MTIRVGDKLPEATFKVMTDEGLADRSSADIFTRKNIVLFAVPGAYTPTCHLKHMPGFVEQAEAIKAKGIDGIVCITVNDPFVAKQWAKDSGAEGKVTVLADSNGDFTRAIGLELDATAHGLGIRSKRYAAIVDDGTLKALIIEDEPDQAIQTTAEEILKVL